MKKYNLKSIMKRAWEIKKQNKRNIFSLCLCMAWEEARKGANMDDEIKRLVEMYKIEEADGGMIRVRVAIGRVPQEEIANIKSHKAEILSYIREKRRKKEEAYELRSKKIQAIEGLQEIESCMDAWARWNDDFRTMMETGRSYMTAKRPENMIQDLRDKYPVADAYLKAQKEARRENYELSAIGEKALNRIIDGEDYREVIKDMEQEISEFVKSNVWD